MKKKFMNPANKNRFESFPFKEDKPIFMQMEELASLATFTPEEMRMYEYSLDRYRTTHLAMEYSHREGVQKGLKKGRKEGILQEALRTAREMKSKGIGNELIAEITRLPIIEIEKL